VRQLREKRHRREEGLFLAEHHYRFAIVTRAAKLTRASAWSPVVPTRHIT
jgi:hypothetical protein